MANSTKGGPLPQYMESTYLENERISFRLGDTVDVKSCQKTEGGDKTCCSGSDGACQPKHEALSLEEGISKEAVLKALKVSSFNTLSSAMTSADDLFMRHKHASLSIAFTSHRAIFKL
jgi:hypothetical protein